MDNQTKLFPDSVAVLKEIGLENAEGIANKIKQKIEGLCNKVEVVGSIRRKKPKVHDIDFVILTPSDREWYRIVDIMKKSKAKISCSGMAVIKTLYPSDHNKAQFKVDFYRAQPSTYGILKLIRTGSAEHNMWLAGYAISKGMRLKYSKGLLRGKDVVAGETEEGVFEALELPCPEPEEREIIGEKPLWLTK